MSSRPPSDMALLEAEKNSIPVFTQAWLNACITHQKFLAQTDNPRFVYTEPVPITAYWKLFDYWPAGEEHTCLLKGCCKAVSKNQGGRGKQPAATPTKKPVITKTIKETNLKKETTTTTASKPKTSTAKTASKKRKALDDDDDNGEERPSKRSKR